MLILKVRGSRMTTVCSDKLIEQIQEKIFEKRPVLREIMAEFGEMSLYDYAKRYYRSPEYPIEPKRKADFLEVFEEEVASVHGPTIAKSCAEQVGRTYHLASAEHHGPIGTTLQASGNLLAMLPTMESKNRIFPNNINTACSKISFNNESFGRGFKFHTYSNKGLSENQLLFFGHSVDNLTLYNHKGFNSEAIKAMRKSLYTNWNERFIWKREFRAINLIIDEVFAREDILSERFYTNQIAKINLLVWRKVADKLGGEHQDVVYVELERLANRLLLNCHLDRDTTVSRILFNQKYLDLVAKYFDGIACGFSEAKNYGTFHFWAISKAGKSRIQLWRRGNMLVSSDSKYKYELTPSAIRKGLVCGELIPSTMLCFVINCLYYSVRQIGGPSQTTYLTQMKGAYISLLTDSGDTEDIHYAEHIPTKDVVIIDLPLLAFMKGPSDELIPATPLDLYLYGNENTLDIACQIAKKITLRESFLRALPSRYKLSYSEIERDKALAQVDEEYIYTLIDFKKKFIPFTSIGRKADHH